ncbi:MAG TPA: flippase activity-associated protein Agl23 [Pelolinea sp.]|nr:flippase activity-associated protein Agl23 [Pelolinea sp.]
MQINLEKPINEFYKKISIFHLLIIIILLLTAFTRFYGLGDRVMSHDEVNHVVPAFDLFSGRGYRHDPVTHGPLQFHLMALSFFLFGDNDLTSRLPHALFSVATVGFVLVYFKRYLGKAGAISAGIFFAISPFMMFYGRYARNDAICAFLNVVALYAVLRFLQEGSTKHLLLLTAALSLNFTSKETAYIFTAQLLIFVFILTLKDLFRDKGESAKERKKLIVYNLFTFALVFLLVGVSALLVRNLSVQVQSGDLSLVFPSTTGSYSIVEIITIGSILLRISLPIASPLLLSLGIILLMRNKLRWDLLKQSRAFDLLVLSGTFVLPLLAPFLVIFSGQNPIAYSQPFPVLIDYIYLAYLFALSVIIGMIWNEKAWWKYAVLFFGIYVVFYSTFFTNTVGLMTGTIGSLGHWLAQQGERRGGQPPYYFVAILIPMYEFLGAFGSILAFILGIRQRSFWTKSLRTDTPPSSSNDESQTASQIIPVPAIFLYWSITSLTAYTLAGEKMPWLTVHIVFSMLLTAGWVLEKIYQRYEEISRNQKGRFIHLLKVFLFIVLIGMAILQLLGDNMPFRGKTQLQLQDTNHFIFLMIMLALSGFFLYQDIQKKSGKQIIYTILLSLFFILSFFTLRTAYQAAFINYDYPLEFLVYAHAADGPKIVLDQIEEISRRTTRGLDIKVAYDNHGLYPYWWYLRDYPNKIVYLENPTRALEEAPLIIAGSDKYAKIDAIARDNYYAYEYMRLWWPMQDYWNLTFDRIRGALFDPEMRQALFNIWLNRDYTLYAQITGNQFLTLENWLPSEKMRFYVRKDIAAQMWQLNNLAALQTIELTDPYSDKIISRQPDLFIGQEGAMAGDLSSPKGLDVFSDGTIFVADTNNHRIQQFSPTGEILNVWGTYANILDGDAPGGTLNQPWDIAVSKDGMVYVTDTFNHRIIKFTINGKFIKSIGTFAQGTSPESLWGPRGIAIDRNGNILITDTGNKRVVVYDSDLNYISQFGSAGFEAGQFDEPVGIDVSDTGEVAVADTWNRRVQIFMSDESGLSYNQISEFSVEAWFGQSLENKPFLVFSPSGNIIISDPEGSRLLEFSQSGDFIQGWQDLAISSELISQPFGLDYDADGNLWVSDSVMHILMRFDLVVNE